MESKAYKKVKDLTPLEIQIKVLEDIGVKDRIEIRLLKEQLRLHVVGCSFCDDCGDKVPKGDNICGTCYKSM